MAESPNHEAYRVVLSALLSAHRGDAATREAVVIDFLDRHGSMEGLLLLARAAFSMVYADAVVFADIAKMPVGDWLEQMVLSESAHAPWA